MKSLILKFFYVMMYHMGVFKLFYFLNKNKQVVVTYHNVIPDEIFDENYLHLGVSCNVSTFVQQLNILLSRFKITTEIGVANSCIISFDDGYRNNIKVVAPLLHDKKITGLFFIPACYFENQSILWVDKLLMWVSYVPTGNYLILGKHWLINSDILNRRLLWEYIYQKIFSNYYLLEKLLNELDHYYSFMALKKIINEQMYALRFEGMTVDELELMKTMGHKIACHSFKHDILALLSDAALENDFLQCGMHAKKYNTRLYSYPFGGQKEVSTRVINQCKRSDYSAAFVNYENNNDDIYAMGRISLGNTRNKYFIEAKLCGFENFLKKLLNSSLGRESLRINYAKK